jgi:hypothetical protein
MSIDKSLAADYFLKNRVWFGLGAVKADGDRDADTEMIQVSISPFQHVTSVRTAVQKLYSSGSESVSESGSSFKPRFRSWIASSHCTLLDYFGLEGELAVLLGLFAATEERHTENTEKSFFLRVLDSFSSVACVVRCCVEHRNSG